MFFRISPEFGKGRSVTNQQHCESLLFELPFIHGFEEGFESVPLSKPADKADDELCRQVISLPDLLAGDIGIESLGVNPIWHNQHFFIRYAFV